MTRSGSILVAFVIVLAVCGWFAAQIGVTSSRTGLVGDDDPSWQRLSAFYEEFGRPSPFVFVVQGGTPEQRRATVDALQRELATEEDFAGRMLGRLAPETVAPLLLLQQPDALAQLRAGLPPDADLPAIIEGGFAKWFSTLEAQVYAGLDGADDPDPSRPGPTPEQAAEGLRRLAMLAKVLDDVLAGADALGGLLDQAGDAAGVPAAAGLDARGYTVTGDGERHLLSLFADLPSDEAADLEPYVERIDAARERAAPEIPDGVEVILTGMPKFIVEELDVIRESTMTSSVATALGVALLCLLLFRSFVQMVIALIPLLPGVVVTFAFIQISYENLNLITSSFIAALLGLGIDFSVHALARFHEERRSGANPEDAVRRAMVYTGPGIATGAVVTIAAFLTTTTTDFSAFGELGLITGGRSGGGGDRDLHPAAHVAGAAGDGQVAAVSGVPRAVGAREGAGAAADPAHRGRHRPRWCRRLRVVHDRLERALLRLPAGRHRVGPGPGRARIRRVGQPGVRQPHGG